MGSKSKKIVALILTAMMATAALAGCGGGSSSTPKKSTSNSTSKSADGSGSADDGEEETPADAEDGEVLDLSNPETKSEIIKNMKEEATDGKITLNVWCSSTDLEFEKTLAKKFSEEYSTDGLTIVVKVKGAIGEDQAGSKIVEAPEDGADVFNFADDQLSDLIEAKDIAPVSKMLRANVKKSNTLDAMNVVTSDGTIYAYPKTSDNGYFMYYDKRVFKENQVGNFDEMINIAKAAGKKVYFNLSNAWYNTGFYFTAGCKIERKGKTQIAEFDNDKGLAAAQAMCHIAKNDGDGFVGSPGTQGDNAYVQQGFKSGELCAAVIGTWEGPDIKEAIGADNVGAAKLPTVLMSNEQKQLDSFGGYKLVGVNKYSKAQFSSHVLALYLTSADSQLQRYKTRGLIPTNTEALEDNEIKNDPALKAINDQKPYAHPQGSSVGGKYWAANVAGFGGEIVTKKGNMDDATLRSKLEAITKQMAD